MSDLDFLDSLFLLGRKLKKIGKREEHACNSLWFNFVLSVRFSLLTYHFS